ncbi:MAG: hypothetical protein ACM34H_10185 [Deltaproteobacteria bacterium]
MAKPIRPLDPIIDEYSRILILGTMPGPESLKGRPYCANQRMTLGEKTIHWSITRAFR